MLVFSCKQKFICPLKEIEWDYKKSNASSEERLKFDADINAKLKAYFKKIGEGEINAKISPAIDELAHQYTFGEIKYDDHYVENYNALVNDICTKLQIIKSKSLSNDQLDELEKDLVSKLKNFYETTRNYTPNAPSVVPDVEYCSTVKRQVDSLIHKLSKKEQITRDTDLLINIMFWRDRLQGISKYDCSFIVEDKIEISKSISKAKEFE